MISKDSLKEIVKEQYVFLAKQAGLVSREILPEVPTVSNHAVIISGIRRCGKSTLLLQISKHLKKYHYFNFEDARLVGFDVSDFDKLEKVFDEVKPLCENYFFDEIQNIDKWELFVRKLLDRKKNVFITGSNASLLSKELGTKLTGRNLKYELYPFSYFEYLKITKQKKSISTFENYFVTGGFPEFILNNNIKILQGLVSDILFRDIITRYNIRNIAALQSITNYLLSNVGKEFSFTKLASAFGVASINTIISLIKYLEDCYLIFTISKFDYSIKKQAVNPKKVYAIDTGLIRANTLSFSADKGRMLENIVFIHLKRKNFAVFYYRVKNECDFVVVDKGKPVQAIQVCYELNDDNKTREMNGLLEVIIFFKFKKGLILTYNTDDEFVIDGKHIQVLPVWKWLL